MLFLNALFALANSLLILRIDQKAVGIIAALRAVFIADQVFPGNRAIIGQYIPAAGLIRVP